MQNNNENTFKQPVHSQLFSLFVSSFSFFISLRIQINFSENFWLFATKCNRFLFQATVLKKSWNFISCFVQHKNVVHESTSVILINTFSIWKLQGCAQHTDCLRPTLILLLIFCIIIKMVNNENRSILS